MNVLKGKFFVTGTDTDAGKTWVSCRMLEAARDAGIRCYGLKPVAAGCDESPEGLRNDDALRLMSASTEKLPYELVNPVALREPVAPHLAARNEGKRLMLGRVAGYVRGALNTHRADLVLVEGAGGWRVPLNDREYLSGLARELELPVMLVVPMRLGCINHALLTAEAVMRDGCRLAGWIANVMEPDMPLLAENIETLEDMMPAPRLVLPGALSDGGEES